VPLKQQSALNPARGTITAMMMAVIGLRAGCVYDAIR
jgi:hypothetical protein